MPVRLETVVSSGAVCRVDSSTALVVTATAGHDATAVGKPRCHPYTVDAERSDRYEEAFWWVVSIPASVVAGAVAAVVRPSAVGLVAVGLLAMVGCATEVLVVRTFQRRWAGDPGVHPTSGLPDPLRRHQGRRFLV